MAADSKIEWTHHTFNPWWGCIKVSAACKHCYAETWAKRTGNDVWGGRKPRRFFGDKHWGLPHKWNRDAESEGVRKRVFCASMADVFEARKELDKHRNRLWPIIEATPWLDWLILTKRPERISEMAPWSGTKWPRNVWLGTTVENQKYADRRIPYLAEQDAGVRFLSCEPLLGPIDLSDYSEQLDWIICGGESGPHSRPMNPNWAVDLRDHCISEEIAFHFKQWGHWAPISEQEEQRRKTKQVDNYLMAALGKKKAGRQLEGREHDGFPVPRRIA